MREQLTPEQMADRVARHVPKEPMGVGDVIGTGIGIVGWYSVLFVVFLFVAGLITTLIAR